MCIIDTTKETDTDSHYNIHEIPCKVKHKPQI